MFLAEVLRILRDDSMPSTFFLKQGKVLFTGISIPKPKIKDCNLGIGTPALLILSNAFMEFGLQKMKIKDKVFQLIVTFKLLDKIIMAEKRVVELLMKELD